MYVEAAIGAVDEQRGGEGPALAQFGADEEADGAGQLQLRLLQRRHRQEAVQQVHRQREHVVLTALLLTHLPTGRRQVRSGQVR